MSRRGLGVLAGLLGVGLLAPAVLVGSGTASAETGVGATSRAAAGAFTQTKALVREFVSDDGSTYSFPANTVTVSVDQTRQLRGRQRVNIAWSGAQPSGGRASNPFGENGLKQEYPVVIMQCRGTDDASLPEAQQVRPETCWTTSVAQRSQINRSDFESIWTNDRDAPSEDRQRISGLTPFPTVETCPDVVDSDFTSTHLTPFVAADGTVYPACDSESMPPEAAIGAAFPAHELSAFSDTEGNGSVRFEVRSDVENESLGCNDKVACSIVVIPINGLSCAAPAARPSASTSPVVTETSAAPSASPTDTPAPTDTPTDTPAPSQTPAPSDTPAPSQTPAPSDTPTPSATPSLSAGGGSALAESGCRKGGQFLPGTSNFANEGVDQAVSPELWWSESNWKNRFSVPITFGLPPDTCDVLDPRPPTGFYGSELLAQAALQWSPAYCLDKKRFKFQLNQMSDEAGFKLMDAGGGAAAVVSGAHKATSDDPVAYAPTAVTGFGIGYNIDRPGNAGEYGQLRMNARLIAKLLTQSYLGSDLGRGHPGIGSNPLSIMSDPEFIALNPGLSTNDQEAAASLLLLSDASDLVEQLTDYIANDKDAMAFVNGKADPSGMVVNPAYKKIKLPRDEWPLLDSFIPTTQNLCRQANPQVYFTQLAAPVTSLRKISDALLDGWPNTQTRCDFDVATNLYKTGRIDRQAFGARFMMGLVSLPDAKRFGLRTAALEAKKGTYVAPTNASLGKALELTERDGKRGPFVLDQKDVRKSGSAYPGTMTVYTAAKLANLPEEDAAKVSQFIRVSTSEGQKAGPGNGELADGYLPITKSGVTGRFYAAAQVAADEIEKQIAQRPEAGDGGADAPTAATGTTSGTIAPVIGAPEPAGVPAIDIADAVAAPAADLPASEPVAMPATQAMRSGLGGSLLPILLLVGVLGGLASAVSRFVVRQR